MRLYCATKQRADKAAEYFNKRGFVVGFHFDGEVHTITIWRLR